MLLKYYFRTCVRCAYNNILRLEETIKNRIES